MHRTTIERRTLRLGRSGHGISPHVTLALPAEVLAALRASAEASNATLSDYVRRLIYLGLDAAREARGNKP